MKKEKSTDEKVYEILCDKFDQMINENTNTYVWSHLHELGAMYAEDLLKRKFDSLYLNLFAPEDYHPMSKVFKDMEYVPTHINWESTLEEDENGNESRKDTPIFTDYVWVYTVRVDSFECRFPIGQLVQWLAAFHKVSGHRGKHKIDWSLTPAYEAIPVAV